MLWTIFNSRRVGQNGVGRQEGEKAKKLVVDVLWIDLGKSIEIIFLENLKLARVDVPRTSKR